MTDLAKLVDGVEVKLTPEEAEIFLLESESNRVRVASEAARYKRDELLRSEVDLILTNPIRFSELTESEKEALLQYRLDLLNVPQQEGFPHSVVWPTKPE